MPSRPQPTCHRGISTPSGLTNNLSLNHHSSFANHVTGLSQVCGPACRAVQRANPGEEALAPPVVGRHDVIVPPQAVKEPTTRCGTAMAVASTTISAYAPGSGDDARPEWMPEQPTVV
jgi:hypothetical protein